MPLSDKIEELVVAEGESSGKSVITMGFVKDSDGEVSSMLFTYKAPVEDVIALYVLTVKKLKEDVVRGLLGNGFSKEIVDEIMDSSNQLLNFLEDHNEEDLCEL